MITIFNGRSRSATSSSERTFVQVEHTILRHLNEFTPSEWMVFCALALHIDDAGYCFPSMSRIETVTGMSAPTIRSAMKGLSEKSIEGRPILLMRPRHTSEGRQTSNEFVLFPGEEGKDFDTLTPKNLIPLEQEPKKQESLTKKRRTKTEIPEPGSDDRTLYEAYRMFRFPDQPIDKFTNAEWKDASLVIWQMLRQGVTPEMLTRASENLANKWGNRKDMVTLRALWKHWSTANDFSRQVPVRNATTINHAQSAVGVLQSIRNFSLDND
jgi:hypothetical protein